MIETIKDLLKIYPNVDIVNYDFKKLEPYESGRVYKSNSKNNRIEYFRKYKNSNKYIQFPDIQPYCIGDNPLLFIIYKNRLFQLGNKDEINHTYSIIKEFKNVSSNLYDDDVFYSTAQKPSNMEFEDIYTIDNYKEY